MPYVVNPPAAVPNGVYELGFRFSLAASSCRNLASSLTDKQGASSIETQLINF
jgi:hypothetical protein